LRPRKIEWMSDTEVEVKSAYYEAGLSASGNTYTLRKEKAKWTAPRAALRGVERQRHQRLPFSSVFRREPPHAFAAAVGGGEAVAQVSGSTQAGQRFQLGEVQRNAADVSHVASTDCSLENVAKPQP